MTLTDKQIHYTMIDLFAGAGGLSTGLQSAGIQCLYANEIQARYLDTYRANHPKTKADGGDIREIDAAAVRRSLGLKKGDLTLIAGGPPCQGFSIYAPKRSVLDERNHLFKEYLRFVDEFQPSAVLIENVPGLVSFERGETLASILTALTDRGYSPDVRILYAPHYGVPQTRWRTIVIALKRPELTELAFPIPDRSAPARVNFTARFAGKNLVSLPVSVDLPQHITVRDALSDLPQLKNGEHYESGGAYSRAATNEYQRLLRTGSPGIYNHEAPKLGPVNMERLKHIAPGGNWTDIPHEMLPAGMKRARRSDHTKRYGRADPDGLSCTILTKCDPHWGAYFHYDQDRIFTVREAARLQSFPDNYVFQGSRIQQYEQVGNAVPPLMARAIGSSILSALIKVSFSRKAETQSTPHGGGQVMIDLSVQLQRQQPDDDGSMVRVSRQALDEVPEYVSFMEMEQAPWRKFRVSKVNAALYRQSFKRTCGRVV